MSIYDGSQVVWTEHGTSREQVDSTTTQALLWAPGIDQLLAIQETLGGLLDADPVWTLPDHQGTVKDYLAKATSPGAVSGLVLTRRYSAFGEPESSTRWSNGPEGYFTDNFGNSGFFYVGQEYDATTGLQYSRARYYDPVSSEFISQDPLGFAGGDTNLYRRAGNSPANATDPSGLAVFLAVPPLLAAAKLALAYAGVQAGFALGETAIEVGATSWAGGEVSAGSAAATFGKNFVINVATGGIGTKAKLASRVGLYALRQGIEIGGDTAFDVGWRDQDFRSSLAINTAGSLIGEAAGRVAIAGARRAIGRGSVDDVLRAGKNAGAPKGAAGLTQRAPTWDAYPASLSERLAAYKQWKASAGISGKPTQAEFRRFVGAHRPNSRGSTLYFEDGGFAAWSKRVGSTHGNTAGSQTAWLYRLESDTGEFLKWGISQDPFTRYSGPFMRDKVMIPFRNGPRNSILQVERDLVERMPGPLNFEPWAGSRLGQ